jgi:hypothetical protein
MADTPDETLEIDLEDEVEPGSDEENEEQELSDAEEGDEETLEVQFGDEAAPASGEQETPLIRHLRTQLREANKRAADALKQAPAPAAIEVGEKPTIASCEYDEEAYERELQAWFDRKGQADKASTDAEEHKRKADEAWQGDLNRYGAAKAKLPAQAMQDAEDTVGSTLSDVQQKVIIHIADNPAAVMLGLSRYPAKLAEISKIENPLKLAAAVAKLEGTLKVTTRRKAPDPEEIVRGNASVAQGKDKTLARLEKEADRTGDSTALVAYRRQLKSPAR